MCLAWLVLEKIFQHLMNERVSDGMVIIKDENGRFFKLCKGVDDLIQNALERRELWHVQQILNVCQWQVTYPIPGGCPVGQEACWFIVALFEG